MMSDDGFKYLGSHTLANLLKELPEGTLVRVNRVGNLSICRLVKRVGEDTFESIGMVDFLFDGEVFWNEP